MCLAISFWHPAASIVTNAPFRDSTFSSSGMAAISGAPGVDQMEAAAEGVAGGGPHRLAVDGDVPQPGGPAHRPHPPGDARPELLGVDPGEYPIEGVVTGDAVGQGEEAPQPALLGPAEPL